MRGIQEMTDELENLESRLVRARKDMKEAESEVEILKSARNKLIRKETEDLTESEIRVMLIEIDRDITDGTLARQVLECDWRVGNLECGVLVVKSEIRDAKEEADKGISIIIDSTMSDEEILALAKSGKQKYYK